MIKFVSISGGGTGGQAPEDRHDARTDRCYAGHQLAGSGRSCSQMNRMYTVHRYAWCKRYLPSLVPHGTMTRSSRGLSKNKKQKNKKKMRLAFEAINGPALIYLSLCFLWQLIPSRTSQRPDNGLGRIIVPSLSALPRARSETTFRLFPLVRLCGG